MAFIDTYNLKTGEAGGQLRARAEVALATVAIETLLSAEPAMEAYKPLAKEILADTGGYLNRVIWPVMTDATVAAAGANATDEQLKAAVLSAIVMFL